MNRRSAGVVLALQALAVAAVSVGYTPPTMADTGGEKMVVLDQIIVTARRREEILQDVFVKAHSRLDRCCSCCSGVP